MFKKLAFAFFCLFSVISIAAPQQPLPVDKAFPLSAYTKDNETVVLEWKIQPSYYLYKDRFSYKLVTPESIEAGPLQLPEGIPKNDELLGDYDVYTGILKVAVPIKNIDNAKQMDLKVCYQGCSENGFCYPPETKQLRFDLKAGQAATLIEASASPTPKKISSHDKVTQLLAGHKIWLILLSFMGFGLLLSFTPCVLPMIPILSGLIVGHSKNMTTWHAFRLSLVYVLAMALTYAIVGVAAGFAGQSIQVALQTPAVIAVFSGIFVLLALSLFGFYEIKLPSRFETKLTDISSHQKSGSYLGVAVMGVLSTLIVSPCITPPLIGALAYIGETGDSVLGGLALFSLGLGMGIPLIIIGTSHGKLLPKAGGWMDAVKAFFGVMLLATAIWLLSRILPGQVIMLLWAGLLLISAVYMGLLSPHNHSGWGNLWRGLGLIMAVYGIMLMIGAAIGNTNPLEPLKSHIPAASASPFKMQAMPVASQPLFKTIKSNEAFDQALEEGVENKQITVLDFYADWCIACKDMEAHVFTDPEVIAKLQPMHLLRSDVTANDIEDKALQERLKVIAPPTILFFDENGSELADFRIVGEMSKQEFIDHLNELAARQ